LEERHALRRERAERPPAVGDDLDAVRQLREVRLELGKRDRDRTGDVTGLVLLDRPEIDDNRVARADPLEQLGPAHGLDWLAEIRARRSLGVGEPVRSDGADRGQQLIHIVPGEAVEDPGPIPTRHDETRAPQFLKMRGRQADRDGSPSREDLDAALALGEKVEQLDPVRVSERAADPGELLV
jgi:hypothetical protein